MPFQFTCHTLKHDYVWHGHHKNDIPLEKLSGTIEERRQIIFDEKPKSEQEIRLRLLKLASPKAIKAFKTYWIQRATAYNAYRTQRAMLADACRVQGTMLDDAHLAQDTMLDSANKTQLAT